MVFRSDKKIKYMLDVMSSAAISKIHEAIGKLNEFAEKSEGMFGNATSEDMSNLMKGIAKLKDMKEEDIAKAVLDNAKAGE